MFQLEILLASSRPEKTILCVKSIIFIHKKDTYQMVEVVQLLGGWLDLVLGGLGGELDTKGPGDEQVLFKLSLSLGNKN